MRPIPSTPSFALVGQPNEGKTTVMATLAEDDQAAISPIPGTTQSCRRYSVRIDGAEILVFYDTPGFENPEATLEWFENNRSLSDPLAAFIATFRDSGSFKQETEILKPLSEGAAVIYVADASRPVRPVDRQEVEILRLTGVRRIGVINSKEGRGEYLNDWKEVMARDFNHIHEFNGHRATFQDRLKLLEAARQLGLYWLLLNEPPEPAILPGGAHA
jgi:predicted GTPase